MYVSRICWASVATRSLWSLAVQHYFEVLIGSCTLLSKLGTMDMKDRIENHKCASLPQFQVIAYAYAAILITRTVFLGCLFASGARVTPTNHAPHGRSYIAKKEHRKDGATLCASDGTFLPPWGRGSPGLGSIRHYGLVLRDMLAIPRCNSRQDRDTPTIDDLRLSRRSMHPAIYQSGILPSRPPLETRDHTAAPER